MMSIAQVPSLLLAVVARPGLRSGLRLGSRGSPWLGSRAALRLSSRLGPRFNGRFVLRLGAALLLLTPALATGAEPPRLLSVAEATVAAIANNPQVTAARAHAGASLDAARSMRGRLLPGVHVSDEQDRYREPWIVEFDLGIPNTPPPSLKARELNTNTFVVAVEQPLLGLARLSQDYAALSSTAEAAQHRVRASEADIRQDVEAGFLHLFEARALGETAVASEQQLAEQMQVMRAKVKIGVATDADVLRLEVALANARQQEIQAKAQEQVTRAYLLAAIGREQDDASIDFAEPTSLEEVGEPSPELHAAIARAVAHRPELAAEQLVAQAAQQRAHARTLAFLPDVNLEAAYIHIQGESLAPADSAYVGLKANWAVFEWGTTFYDRRAADEEAIAAAAQSQGAHQRVGTEVSVRIAQMNAATSAVAVARTVITSADEAYRVTRALVQAGSATTTDLLDAQSALTQARLNLVRARYELALAHVAFEHAVGE